MSSRSATRVVALVVLGVTAFFVAGAVFFVEGRSAGRSDSIFSYGDLAQQVVGASAFLLAGVVVSTRRPSNRIGWLCLVGGAIGILGWAAEQYAAHALVIAPGSLPAGLAVAVITEAAFAPSFVVLLLTVVLFPDGQLLSRRWRPVPILAIVAFSGLWAAGSMAELSSPFAGIENPLNPGDVSPLVPILLVGPFVVLAIVAVVGAFASVVVRFRRSRGDEREQLKWLATAATVLPAGLIAHALAETFAPGATGTIELLFSVGVLAIPVAIGIAVLKYRLYEIDTIISRTLVYGSLTIVLAATYVGLVLGAQAAFSSIAGGSDLAVAVSTLVVAALFLPLRRRVQAVVDRRFYRRRYDARQTLEGFGARLREQTALEALADDLVGVVDTTMRPEHLSLWLRPPVTIP